MVDISPIKNYLNRLTNEFSSISEVWLIGSRANNYFKKNSAWDLLVFADKSVLENIRKDKLFKQKEIDLFIIYNGNNFELPWRDKSKRKKIKKGSLVDWEWQKETEGVANYEGWSKTYIRNGIEQRNGINCKAIRIWQK